MTHVLVPQRAEGSPTRITIALLIMYIIGVIAPMGWAPTMLLYAVFAGGALLASSSGLTLAAYYVASVIIAHPQGTEYAFGQVANPQYTVITVASALLYLFLSRRMRYLAEAAMRSWPIYLLLAFSIFTDSVNSDFSLTGELSKCLLSATAVVAVFLSRRCEAKQILTGMLAGLSLVPLYLGLVHIGWISSVRMYWTEFGGVRAALPRQDPNATGYLLVLMLATVLSAALLRRIKGRQLNLLLAAALMILVVYTGSRASVITGTAVILWWSLRLYILKLINARKPGLLLHRVGLVRLAAAALVAVGLLVLTAPGLGTSAAQRVEDILDRLVAKGLDTRQSAYEGGLALLEAKPLAGWGLMPYVEHNKALGASIYWSHNTFLDIAIAGGIPQGLYFFTLVLVTLIQSARLSFSPNESQTGGLLHMGLVAGVMSMFALSMMSDKLFWMLMLYAFVQQGGSRERFLSLACTVGAGWRGVERSPDPVGRAGSSAQCARSPRDQCPAAAGLAGRPIGGLAGKDFGC
mgnify:FL=1